MNQYIKETALEKTLHLSGIREAITLLTLNLNDYQGSSMLNENRYLIVVHMNETRALLTALNAQLEYLVEQAKLWEES